jgi:transposase-like protein
MRGVRGYPRTYAITLTRPFPLPQPRLSSLWTSERRKHPSPEMVRHPLRTASITLLRCATCGREFSELKGTALWNLKLPHEQVESIVEHVTRGNSFKETAELTHTHRTTVSRLACSAGEHATRVHQHCTQDLQVTSLEADERHGFVGRKDQPVGRRQ